MNKDEAALGYQYEIRVKQNPKIFKTYSVPLALRNKVGDKINEILDAQVIERAESPFCNPLRIV